MTTLPIELVDKICQSGDYTTLNAIANAGSKRYRQDLFAGITSLQAPTITLKAFKQMSSLISLELGRMSIDLEFSKCVACLPNLKVLKAYNCKYMLGNVLANFSGLEWLEVYDDPSTISFGTKHLKNLKHLRVNGGEIRDEDLSHLLNLEYLEMAGNRLIVTDEGIQQLTKLKSLKAEHAYHLTENSIGKLVDLEELVINDYEANIHKSLRYLPKLKTVRLECLHITPNQLHIYPSLEQIDICIDNFHDNDLAIFTGIRWVALGCCVNITDNGLKHLAGAERVNIYGCKGITDIGIKYLSGVKKLEIDSDALTSKCFEYLQGIKTLKLYGTVDIKDDDFVWLSGIKTLYLSNARQLTDNGLSHLTGIKNLRLTDCNIGDNGLVHLKGIKKFALYNNCGTITDTGINYLIGIKELRLDNSDLVTDQSISKLNGIVYLGLNDNNTITSVSLKHLKSLIHFWAPHNNKITTKDKALLPNVNTFQVDYMYDLRNYRESQCSKFTDCLTILCCFCCILRMHH